MAVADPDAIISIIGDLNSLDHSKLEAESGLVQLVHDVTHGKNILDKFLTNNPDLFSVRVASSTIKTKHKTILANCSTDPAGAANKRGRAIHSFPDIRTQHMALLRETLAAYNWGAVYAAGNDIDVAYENFLLIIKGLIKMCIPFKTITVRESDPWFVTPLVKSLLRQRNYLYHRGQVTKADTLSLKISILQIILVLGKIINAVRSDRFSNVDVRDSKKLWQMIKSNTNYNSRCTIESLGKITKLTSMNKLII